MLAEKRAALELRRKRVRMDVDEVAQKSQEQKLQAEREKNDIKREIDEIESQHQRELRESRNKQIEMEVDAKRTIVEREKVAGFIEQEEREAYQRSEELALVKKQIQG